MSLGFTNSSFNVTNFIFEDQINVATGFITSSSDDPLSERLANLDYLDLGTSILIHNHELLFGLTLAHLNQPNISVDDDVTNKLPLKIGLQAGYEINMNPYHGNFLPDNTFLFLYSSWTKIDKQTNYFFAQDLQLGSFSMGLNQQASSLNTFSFTHAVIHLGTSVENFDFGFQYALPLKVVNQVNPLVFLNYI